MDDPTSLVTGANSGIGKETTRGLAERGHRVLMLCRDEERAEEARREIAEDTGNGDLEIVLCDLSSQTQIQQAGYEVQTRVDELDVLVNNAGAVLDERRVTEDGVEEQFAVNHLGPFLLTHELLDLLQQAGREGREARVVTVASEAHRRAGRLPDAFQNLEGYYQSFWIYSQTKLYNVCFTRELARRLDPDRVSAHCLHPGVIGSRFGQSGPWYVRWFMRLAQPFLTDPSEGARTPLFLATADEIDPPTGGYFVDREARQPDGKARDPDVTRELWRVSEELTGARDWPEPDDR